MKLDTKHSALLLAASFAAGCSTGFDAADESRPFASFSRPATEVSPGGTTGAASATGDPSASGAGAEGTLAGPASLAQPPLQGANRPKAARKGDWEATLVGGGSNDDRFNSGAAAIGGSIGYYLSDAIEVLFRHDMSYVNFGPETWDGNSRIAIDANLLDTHIRPYIGGNVGYVYGDTTAEGVELAPEAGVKWYLKDKVFLNFHAEYQFVVDRGEDFSDDFSQGTFVYALGFGINF